MDNTQVILNELSEIKELVKSLKTELAERDKRIEKLEELLKVNSGETRNPEELSAINSGDPEVCYSYALKHPEIDMTDLSDAVAKTKNLKYNHLFMKNIKGCDFSKHLKVILDSKDPEYCYYAALLQPDREIVDQIRKIIVNSKSVEHVYEFANDLRYIYGVADNDEESYDFLDVSDLEQVILDHLDVKYAYMFAKNVKGADIELLEEVVLDMASITDLEYVFSFGVDIKGADLERCRQKIVDIYKDADTKKQKEITNDIDGYERRKIKCIFRNSFADKVEIK